MAKKSVIKSTIENNLQFWSKILKGFTLQDWEEVLFNNPKLMVNFKSGSFHALLSYDKKHIFLRFSKNSLLDFSEKQQKNFWSAHLDNGNSLVDCYKYIWDNANPKLALDNFISFNKYSSTIHNNTIDKCMLEGLAFSLKHKEKFNKDLQLIISKTLKENQIYLVDFISRGQGLKNLDPVWNFVENIVKTLKIINEVDKLSKISDNQPTHKVKIL